MKARIFIALFVDTGLMRIYSLQKNNTRFLYLNIADKSIRIFTSFCFQ